MLRPISECGSTSVCLPGSGEGRGDRGRGGGGGGSSHLAPTTSLSHWLGAPLTRLVHVKLGASSPGCANKQTDRVHEASVRRWLLTCVRSPITAPQHGRSLSFGTFLQAAPAAALSVGQWLCQKQLRWMAGFFHDVCVYVCV